MSENNSHWARRALCQDGPPLARWTGRRPSTVAQPSSRGEPRSRPSPGSMGQLRATRGGLGRPK
eukprot:9248060-Lingulodinium_polyedra.AAC.1